MHIGMWELLLLGLIIVLLFGSGKISGLMGDVGKGIKAFKEGLADKPETPAAEPQQTSAASTPTPPAQLPPPAKPS